MIVELGIQRGGPMDGKHVVLLPVIVGEPITLLLYRCKEHAGLVHCYCLDELTNTDKANPEDIEWASVYRYTGMRPASDFPHVKA